MPRSLPLLLWLAVGCSSPTELVLVVDSNLSVPGELDAVEVLITGPDGVETRAPQALDAPGSPTFPLTLGIAPEGDTLGPLGVAAIGLQRGRVVVRQDAIVTLEAGRSKVLHLYLLRSCVGRICEAGTCGEAGCVATARGELPDWSGTPDALPDEPCLALPYDADGDGHALAMCGGADCDDGDAAIGPTVDEGCDGVDNNCDGVVDEGCGGCTHGATEACMTSCGGVGERVCEGGSWSACAAGPDPCNYLDDDCDGFTDEGVDYVVADERAVVGNLVVAGHPSLIWADDRYALAFDQAIDDGDLEDREAFVVALDRDGTPVGAAFGLGGLGQSPRLAWSGTAFGAVTIGCESDARCTGVRFQVVNAGLSANVGTTLQLDNNNDGEPRARVGWDGTSFVTSSYDPPNIEVRWIDATGRMQVERRIALPRPGRPDLAVAGTELRLVHDSADEVHYRAGTRMGFPLGPAVAALSRTVVRPSIAVTETGSFVAWLSDETPNDIRVAALDPSGAPVSPPLMLATRAPIQAGDERNAEPGIAASPGQVLVTWVSGEAPAAVHFARLSLDGQIIQSPTVLGAVDEPGLHPVPAWSGAGFGVVWAHPIDSRRQHIRFASVVCPPAPP